MRRKIVAGNWKMNGDRAVLGELLDGLLKGYASYDKIEWIVFPSSPYLALVEDKLKGTKIAWGAQDISEQASGAFTGDISAAMVKDFSSQYVLAGHSERRHGHHESNELVALKVEKALKGGLKPIICVGETLEERKNNQTLSIVHEQLNAVFNLIKDSSFLNEIVIAYEPVWAIGTGQVATPEQAQAVHRAIRDQLTEISRQLGATVPILYGGSVKPDNAETLFKMADIDGALVGGASLKADQFLAIGEICNQLS